MLKSITSTILNGRKETLYNPPLFECSDQIHEPFRLRDIPAQIKDDDQSFLWGVVETRGIQFSGDRTDIHDVLSRWSQN